MVRLQKIQRKLYFRDSRYSEYASGSQYTKILNVSGILYVRVSQGIFIEKVVNTRQVLNIPEF